MPTRRTQQTTPSKSAERRPPSTFPALIAESIRETKELRLVHGIEKLEGVSTITALVDLLLRTAFDSGASDIHIDPQDDRVVVRYRIDGILHDVVTLKSELHPLVISRLKVLAGLRTDEHFAAQDGRFRTKVGEADIDVRVSIVPTHHDENAVLRLLVGSGRALGLGELGMSERDLTTLHRYIRKPYGMILATGPTGSGKTTTLYSILQLLNARAVSIVTIEDPIEYAVPGITQIQVNPQTNLTFAAGLRAIVRQDPNVIMVGEIRDQETAGVAVNSALTGHLLLSTIHTNDAATTLPRLLDMGVEPFLIASTVNVAVGQRLVRRLCEHCREQYELSKDERASLASVFSNAQFQTTKKFWRANGCATCNSTGYTKRVGIYEILEITDGIRKLIMRQANADELRQAARAQGMTTMLEDGFTKAVAGVTSLAEILRVVHD